MTFLELKGDYDIAQADLNGLNVANLVIGGFERVLPCPTWNGRKTSPASPAC